MKRIWILTLIAFLIIGTSTMAHAKDIQTYGTHHIGLAVKDLQASADFFIKALEFEKVGGKPDYPSIFVSDGHVMVTLWQADEGAKEFNRKDSVGLHHLAFKLDSQEDLDAMHEKIKSWPAVEIEFAPELVGEGPAKHFIFSEPSGIRLEFFALPKDAS